MPPLSFILPTTTHRRFVLRPYSLIHRFLSTGSPPIEYPLSHPIYSKFSEIFHHRQSQFSVFASNHTLKVSIPAAKLVSGSGFGVETDDIGKSESGFWDLRCYEETKLQIERGKETVIAGEVSELICKTIYGWREAVSPHLAAHRENAVVADSVLLEMLKGCLAIGSEGKSDIGEDVSGFFSLIETAGGVASPGPSGSLQCDLYRCMIFYSCLI